MGLGWHDSIGEYCGPHTASSVFLILVLRSCFIFYYTRGDYALWYNTSFDCIEYIRVCIGEWAGTILPVLLNANHENSKTDKLSKNADGTTFCHNNYTIQRNTGTLSACYPQTMTGIDRLFFTC